VIERARSPLGLREDLKERRPGVLPSGGGNFTDAPPNQRLIRGGRHRGDLNALETAAANEVLPAVDGGFNLAPRALPDRRIGQPREHLFTPTLLHPERQRGRQARPASGVGVHGRVHACAVGIGVAQLRDHLAHGAPLLARRHFQVEDHHRDLRFAADGNRFVERAHQVEALTPHVRRVHPSVTGRDFSQRDQLPGFGEGTGRIDQGARQADRPALHRRFHHRLHPLKLLRRGVAVVEPDDLPARHGGWHQRAEIDGDALLLEASEVAVEAGPVERDAERSQRLGISRLRGPERRRIAFADDLGRDALPNVALAVAVREQRGAGLPLHIDEPGRDDESGGVDFAPSLRTCQIADRDDAVALDPDINTPRFALQPVVDDAATNDQIKGRILRLASDGGDADERRQQNTHSHSHRLHRLHRCAFR
jgi:hypothetical protein